MRDTKIENTDIINNMDKQYTYVASTTMGLEAIVRDECKDLGFANVTTSNGKIEFTGDAKTLCSANINLRCADRVFVKVGEFEAMTFERLFNRINELPWENYIDRDGAFPISWVSSVKSRLFSKSDIQRIAKKAIVERLKTAYRARSLPETGANFAIKIQGTKDIFSIMIDSSGDALHKRGYRKLISEAPLKETLAAALVYLSHWTGGNRPLIDPMCGSGTLAIEAAMIARNIAPGANRRFVSEDWSWIPEDCWVNARDEAFSNERYDRDIQIYASDIDKDMIKIAIDNAKMAGVDDVITFECKDIKDIANDSPQGCILTNPPYGARLMSEEEMHDLYTKIGNICRDRFPKWSYYLITAYDDFEASFGKKSTKNRKLYNGGLECHYYMYYGEGRRVTDD